MTTEILREVLSEKSEMFTLHEIAEMLDEELEKPVDEMDTDIVDLCPEALKEAAV